MQAGDTRHHRTHLLLGLFAADVVFLTAHRNDQVPIRIRRDLIACLLYTSEHHTQGADDIRPYIRSGLKISDLDTQSPPHCHPEF